MLTDAGLVYGVLFNSRAYTEGSQIMRQTQYKESFFENGQRGPLVITPATDGSALADLLSEDPHIFEQQLLEHGAILFRGFAVKAVADFDKAIDALGLPRMDYNYRSTPRTELKNKIYTATQYPPSEEIPLHNENSYQRAWPLKIVLCCLKASQTGGRTPIADMRKVTAAIPAALLDKFEERRVQYSRHYQPYIDLQWQTVFQTMDLSDLARFCAKEKIEHTWLREDMLRTTQVAQGVAFHPHTKEKFFFNQAHLFHISSLGDAKAKMLLDTFGAHLPRQAYYGDGGEIPLSELQTVREAFDANKISFDWQVGDVLLADNMQWAHGRQPYGGERQVVVSLLEPYSGEQRD